MTIIDTLIKAIKKRNLKISFSVNCISGFVPTYAKRCECWRCRKDRGEPPNEKLAKKVSDKARSLFEHRKEVNDGEV